MGVPGVEGSGELGAASHVADFKVKAVKGTAILIARGMALRALGLLGMVLLAKRLVPSDYGAVALGLTIMAAGTLMVDGGLGAALIRRPEAPTRDELRALTGLQLVIATAVAVAVTAVGPFLGQTGIVCAVMIWALPLTALQIPGGVLLERELDFGRRIRVELAESLTYFLWAVPIVWAGGGVMGMATASLARAVAGVVVMRAVSPVGILRPAFSMSRVRGLLGFGFRFQLVSVVNVLRDQGVNFIVAGVAGVAVLGLWSVAYRALLVPFLLFEALWRVSYPAMSQLVQSGEDPAPSLRKAMSVGSVGACLALTPLAASAPALFELLLGTEWTQAADAVAPSALGLLVAAPISVTAAGYTYAVGNTRRVMAAAIAHAVAWVVVMAPLLGPLGVRAVGIGWLASGLVDAAFFVPVLRGAGVRLLGVLLPVWLAGLCGYGAGAAVLAVWGVSWWTLMGSVTSSLLVLVGVLLVLRPDGLTDSFRLLRSASPRLTRRQRRGA